MSLSRLEELLKLAKLGQLDKAQLTQKSLLATALFPESTEQLHRYFSYKAVPGVINPFRIAETTGDNLILGLQGRTLDPIGMSDQDINRHIVVAGATGSGKTNWLNFFASQLLYSGKSVIWLDLKNEARHLLRAFSQLRVFRVKDFRWNPLEVPEGVDPKHWLNTIVSVYAHAFGILHASEGTILQYIDDLYQQYGVYEGSGRFPCLFDLVDYLDQMKVRPWSDEARYLSRTKNRIQTMCRVLGESVAVSKGFDVKALLNRSWVLELGPLKPDVQSFVAEAILMTLFTYRMANGVRNNGVSNVIIFDDAKRIWDRNKERRPVEGIPTITNIISQVREFGVAVLVADQDPQMLSQSLIDNAGTKICMSLGSGRAVNEMATAMGLTPGQMEFIYKFQPGHACCKIVGKDPFLMVVPEFPVQKNVTDDDLNSRVAVASDIHKIEPRVQLEAALKLDHVEDREKRKFASYSGNSSDIPSPHPEHEEIRPIRIEDKRVEFEEVFGETELKMCLDVIERPTSGVAERYRRLKLSAEFGDTLVETLVSAGILSSDFVKTSKGRIRFLQITDKGLELLNKAGYQVEKKRRGGPEHEYWKHKLAKDFSERGYSVTFEKPIGRGQTVDLEARLDDKAIAVEIETGKSDAESNLEKLISAGYMEIWMVFATNSLPQLHLPEETAGINIRVKTTKELCLNH